MIFGFGKPSAPPQNSFEKFLSSRITNQGLLVSAGLVIGGAIFGLGQYFDNLGQYFDNDLKADLKDLKPLLVDVASEMASISASLPVIKEDIASPLKTSIGFLSYDVALATWFSLVVGLIIVNVQQSKELTALKSQVLEERRRPSRR